MPQLYDGKKNSRVISIMSMLDDGKPRRTDELAAHFGVNVRSIQRDFKSIRNLGFELEFPGKGLVKFAEGVSLKKRPLSTEQQQGLKIFRVFAKTLAPELARSCEALVKSFEEEKSGPEIIPIMPERNIKDGQKYIDEIFEAIEFAHALRISYQPQDGKKKDYEIRPFALLYNEGFIYVFSALWNRPSEHRTYRLDRIKELEHLYDKTFSPPQNLRSRLKGHNIWGIADRKIINVKLEIDGWAVDYFKNFELFKAQKIKEKKDGSISLEGKISKFEEIIPQILRWMPCVRVVSPAALSAQVRKIVDEYLKKSD